MVILLCLFLSLLHHVGSIIFFDGCNSNCLCDYRDTNLTIRCYMNSTHKFQLPGLFSLTENTTSITITESFLTNYPSNICQHSSTLLNLDLSNNQLSQHLNASSFYCLKKLEYLNLSNNSITTIEENSFDLLNNLKQLDLSYNRIETIPTYLFYFKLPNLTYLNLKNNLIKELDVWMLFLKSINRIDLSYNQIGGFVNKVGWNPFYVSPNIRLNQAELIDLRYNKLTSFDDGVLKLFSICSPREFEYFLNLFNKLLFDNNDLVCTCENSYNLLSFYQEYITKNTIKRNDLIFFHKCSSPSEYYDKNLFSFTEYYTCSNSSSLFDVKTCGFRTTTTTTTQIGNLSRFKNPLLKIENATNQSLSYLNDAQIAGYAMGLFGFILLFLILVCFICPIEILAVCFNNIPFFYSVCPCKSGVKRNKEYDLFISYNRVNEKWVRNYLIPFIRRKDLVSNYCLHYNSENKLGEVFGSYVQDVMNRSSCILFVLSDAFLMKEWNNKDFRDHLRYLITREKTRFIVIQMHDISDEEVEEYFTQKLQIPRFVSLENDEFLFWQKLGYFLYTNNNEPGLKMKHNKINDGQIKDEKFSSALFSKYTTPELYSSSTSFDLPSIGTFEEPSIYNSSSRLFPKRKEKNNMRKKIIMNKTSKNILLTTNERKPISSTDNFQIRHEIMSDESFNFVRTNDVSLKSSYSNRTRSEREYMNNLIYQQKVLSNNGRYPSVKKNPFRSNSDSDNQ